MIMKKEGKNLIHSDNVENDALLIQLKNKFFFFFVISISYPSPLLIESRNFLMKNIITIRKEMKSCISIKIEKKNADDSRKFKKFKFST